MNAIAHGYPNDPGGVVRVELERIGDGRGALTVTDDGQGYDPDTVAKTRLGLWLISGLAGQVRGDLTTTFDTGVRCRLEFPLAAPAAAEG